MPLVDSRPPGIHAFFRPGTPKVLELTWPASLTGRTFTASLGSTALTVSTSVSVMTISATATHTASVLEAVPFTLTEVLSGDDATAIIGTWEPSYAPAAYAVASLSVTTLSASVTVNVLANPQTAASNLVDSVTMISAVTGLSVNAFAIASVTGTAITIPNLSQTVRMNANVALRSSVSNSALALMIIPEGGVINSQVSTAWGANHTDTTIATTIVAEYLLAPNNPGNYQLAVYSFSTATLNVLASAANPCYFAAYTV